MSDSITCRHLRALQEGAEALIVRSLTGMVQMLWRLGREGVLLISPIWLEEQLSEVPSPLSARQESKIGETLGQLKELEDMVPKDRPTLSDQIRATRPFVAARRGLPDPQRLRSEG